MIWTPLVHCKFLSHEFIPLFRTKIINSELRTRLHSAGLEGWVTRLRERWESWEILVVPAWQMPIAAIAAITGARWRQTCSQRLICQMGWPKAGSTQFSGPSNRKHDDQRSILLEPIFSQTQILPTHWIHSVFPQLWKWVLQPTGRDGGTSSWSAKNWCET